MAFIFRIMVIAVAFLVAFMLYARKKHVDIFVERTFNAQPEALWKVWNEPESMKSWWGPNGFTAPVIQNDSRVGGKYLLSMKQGEGETIWNVGRYTEVVPMQRMVSLMAFSDSQGNPISGANVKVPGDWPDEVEVTVEFKAVDGGRTRVAVKESGIPLLMKVLAKMGWEQQFDKIEKLISAK